MELEKRGVLKRYRVELIGAKAEAIERAEDRNLFKEAMRDIGLDMPRSGSAHSLAEAEAIAKTIGSWPLIVRPGFTLGGTGGGIAHDTEEFARIVTGGLEASLNHEVLVEESLIGWKEYEMEVMRDKAGNAVIVCSIENMVRDGGDARQGGQRRNRLLHREHGPDGRPYRRLHHRRADPYSHRS